MSKAGPDMPSQPLVTPETPWLGLRAFTEDLRGYFFGRDAELADLFERVAQKPLTILFGQSGLGKTSLLQAALLPRLRHAGFLPVLLRLDHTDAALSLDRQVIEALRTALDASAVEFPAPDAAAPLWRLLHDPACGLCREGAPRVVLLLDQFEEIFTLGEVGAARRSASEAFLHALADVVENRVPAALRSLLESDEAFADRVDYAARPLKVLLSLREDFLHRLERWRAHMPSLMDNRLELRLLNGPQALAAVVEPGRLRCAMNADLPPIADAAVGAAIVRFVADVAEDVPLVEIDAVPPLLSLLCAELNAQRGDSPVIRTEQLEGRAEDILAQFYERCFAPHPLAVRHFVEDRLLSPEGFRQSANHDTFLYEMAQAGLPEADARRVLARLVDDRLLVSEERGNIHRLELTHDTLTGVARRSRDARQAALRRKRRQKYAAIATSAALLVAVVSLVVTPWLVVRIKRAEVESLHAREAERRAERAKGEAEKAAFDARAANEANRKNLRQASIAALAAGIKGWEEDEEAARDGRRAETTGGKSKWHEAVAHFSRAFELDPDNEASANWLYQTLLHRAHGKWDQPAFSLPHGNSVRRVCFSLDGATVITACDDHTARVWNVVTGQPVGPPLKLGGFVVALSADGTKLVTSDEDADSGPTDVQFWTVANGQRVNVRHAHEGAVRGASFSADGKQVVTASHDKTARVWDFASGEAVGGALTHEDMVKSASFSPDGKQVVTASDDKTARVWNVASGQAVGSPLRHNGRVRLANFSPDGTLVVTASGDETARVWNAATGQPVTEPLRQEGADFWSATFSPDGTKVLTACGPTACIWDVASGRLVGKPLGHAADVLSARFSPDGTKVITSSLDKTARVWSVAAGKPLSEPLRHADMILTGSFSPDGTKVVTGSVDKTARIWNVDVGQPVGEPLRQVDNVLSSKFNSDGKKVLISQKDKTTALIWNSVTNQPIGEPLRHGGNVLAAGFSRDRTKIYTTSVDGFARVWDSATGQAMTEALAHEGPDLVTDFSPDGTTLVTASGRIARLWKIATGKLVAELAIPKEKGSWFTADIHVKFSPDGTKLMIVKDDVAQLWDVATGQAVSEPYRHQSTIYRAAFSSDGSMVATSSTDKTVKIWNTATGNLVCDPIFVAESAWSANFSPDGSKVVTAGADKAVRFWNVATGQIAGEPLRHPVSIGSATFSPDMTKVIVSCDDGPDWVWDMTNGAAESRRAPGEIAEWARALVGLRFGDSGELRVIAPEEAVAALAHPKLSAGRWLDLARWISDFSVDRPLHPGAATTLRQVAERERDAETSGNLDNVKNALLYDSCLPLARLLLARGMEEENQKREPKYRDASMPAQCAFLRRYDLDRLPDDAALWARAAESLYALPSEARVGVGPDAEGARAEAVAAAAKATALDPKLADGWRIGAKVLGALHRDSEARSAWKALLSLADASANDFARAGYFAATRGDPDWMKEIFAEAEMRFPRNSFVQQMAGWASINLGDRPAALVAFELSRARVPSDKLPSEDLLAGLSLAQWITGQRDAAIATYQELVGRFPRWADAGFVGSKGWPKAEIEPMQALRDATIKLHPELEVKPEGGAAPPR